MADRDAEFADYFAARAAALRRVAYALCGDWHAAEDLVQATFLQLYRHWRRIRGETLDAYARALLDTAASLGAAHVGIGSDMFGLGGLSVIPGYEQFPQLEELLVKRGLKADDVRNIMGANYARVLGQALAV